MVDGMRVGVVKLDVRWRYNYWWFNLLRGLRGETGAEGLLGRG